MIRILIVDDHAIVRAGLKQFIAGQIDMEVAAEAGSGAEAIAAANAATLDVVLLDISLPDQSGVDVLKRLKHTKPALPVLILSGLAERQYAINLIRAGAAGYLNKEAAASELIGAIRTVAQGRRYLSPTLSDLLAANLVGDAEKPLHSQLSEREFQIFCKLAAGSTVSQIADELFLSVKTVSTYRTRILEKMDMRTNADLTYYAIKNGLVS
jgi:DNA-binding NarL/FixJ family response regulator